MAKYDIVGGIISDAAMKQLQEIEKLATSIGKSLQGVKLSDLSKGGKDAANLEKINAQTQLLIEKTKILEERRNAAASKRITETNDELKAMKAYYSELEKSSAKEAAAATKAADEKRRAQEAVAAANEKARKSTADYKVGVSALSKIEKLKAVITSEHTSALQKLGAQMRLLEFEMQAKFNPALAEQDQEFRNLNAQHKAMQEEFNRTARATGVMGRSSKSAYGSFYQMTQVMRELPNFAIDARIGFMSLSNNLPMLADEFKAVRQEIIDTQGAAGATGKAWAALGKSLLSLNTIMIVASTLLVLFGDDITKFIGQVFSGEKAMKALSAAALGVKTSLTVMRDALSGSEMQKSIESINKLSSNLENAKGNAKESEYYVGEFNKTLGVTFGKAKDVNEALALIDANKDAYIEAMKQMTFANTLFAKSAEYMTKIVEVNMKPQGQIVREAGGDYKKMYEQYQEFNNEIEKAQKEKEKGINPNATVMIGGVFGTAYSLDGAKKARLKLAKEINNIEQTERDRQISIYTKGMNSMEEEARKAAKKMSDIWDENGWGFPVTPESGDKAKVIIREIAAEMKKLSAIDPKTLMFDTPESPTAHLPNVGMLDPNALEEWLNKEADAYERGLQSYADYQKKKEIILDSANARNIDFTDDTNKRLGEIELNRSQSQIEIAQMTIDAISEMWSTYFDYMNEKIEEQLEIETRKNDESIKDAEDRKDAGIMTEKELSDFKERMVIYQQSVEDDAARKKEENDRKAFLLSQSFAAAQIWLEYAKAQQAIIFAGQSFLVGAPAYIASSSALNLASAIAGTSIILAQSIPAFEQGGIVAKDGTILAGEKRHELAILPDGSFFVTANKPTLYDVPKGTEIMPDLNKIDIMDILHLKPLYANHSDNKQTDALLRKIDSSIRNQKQGNFYGMPLIKQLDNRVRFDSRRKSLMN